MQADINQKTVENKTLLENERKVIEKYNLMKLESEREISQGKINEEKLF